MAKTAFTKADVERAVAGAIAGGLSVGRVRILRDGTIELLPNSQEPEQCDAIGKKGKSCDEVFG